MREQRYTGRHRTGRHRAPRRGTNVAGAAFGGAASSAVGLAVMAVAAAGPSPASTAAAAVPASAVPALSAQDEGRQARAEREDRARRAVLREVRVEAARVSRSKAQAKARERAAELATKRWVSPLAGFRLTSSYGPRWGRQHEGLDMAASTGTRVGSLSSGVVVFAGVQGGYGNKVEVRHWDGTVSYYAHLSAITVSVGQRVEPGQKLGEVGSTGRSTGPHLHLQVLPDGSSSVDAYAWLTARGVTLSA